ncbi:hypothetical protein QTP88_026119 [Uroleucon formosanum]
MPKVQSTSAKLRQYVEEFSSTVFKTDGKTLFCNICEEAVLSNKRFQVTQHLSTAKHLSNSTRKEKMKQIFIKDSFEDQNSEFSLDLCLAFLASDILLWKLHNTTFNTFLQKYIGKHIPDESTIRKKCVSVLYNEVIDRIRKEIVFLKAPSRVLKFRELFRELPLPPQSIPTRWGTWLEATSYYYADNFNSIKSVLLSLNKNTAKSIKNAIALFENRNIQNDLAYIKSNLGFITESILKLENASLLLYDNLEIVENTKSKLGQNKGPIVEKINKKYKNVLEKNTGLKAMSTTRNILNGQNINEDFLNLTPGEVKKFRYAKITSCDVKRSVSKYKNTLRSNEDRSFLKI